MFQTIRKLEKKNRSLRRKVQAWETWVAQAPHLQWYTPSRPEKSEEKGNTSSKPSKEPDGLWRNSSSPPQVIRLLRNAGKKDPTALYLHDMTSELDKSSSEIGKSSPEMGNCSSDNESMEEVESLPDSGQQNQVLPTPIDGREAHYLAHDLLENSQQNSLQSAAIHDGTSVEVTSQNTDEKLEKSDQQLLESDAIPDAGKLQSFSTNPDSIQFSKGLQQIFKGPETTIASQGMQESADDCGSPNFHKGSPKKPHDEPIVIEVEGSQSDLPPECVENEKSHPETEADEESESQTQENLKTDLGCSLCCRKKNVSVFYLHKDCKIHRLCESPLCRDRAWILQSATKLKLTQSSAVAAVKIPDELRAPVKFDFCPLCRMRLGDNWYSRILKRLSTRIEVRKEIESAAESTDISDVEGKIQIIELDLNLSRTRRKKNDI